MYHFSEKSICNSSIFDVYNECESFFDLNSKRIFLLQSKKQTGISKD